MIRKYKDYELEGQKETMGLLKDVFDKSIFSMVGNWISQWRQDVDIWKRKICRQRPLRGRGDGPLGKMRKWYRQFYPDYRANALAEGNTSGN